MASDEKKERTAGQAGRSAARPIGDSNVGSALRTAWQKTVSEEIPPDMLDLLGKLN